MKLQAGETVIHELRPDGKIVWLWLFSKGLPASVAPTFFLFWCVAVFGGVFDSARNQLPWPLATCAGLALMLATIFLALSFVYCRALRKTYVYSVTNQRCVFHGGILRKVERSVHYHKITDVETSQTIIERLLGISTLKIFTPGTASMPNYPFGGERAEITFVGLQDSETPAASVNGLLGKFKATGE